MPSTDLWWQHLATRDDGVPAWAKPRCSHCGKVSYTETRAMQVAHLITSQRIPMFAYYSPRCGVWHLTRKAPR